jgi:translation initiation factor IF-3
VTRESCSVFVAVRRSLKEGAKLKAFVFFKGRSIIYKDQGQIYC